MPFAVPALSSEIAYLKNGRSFAIESHRQTGDRIVLILQGQDQLEFDQGWIENIVLAEPPAADSDGTTQSPGDVPSMHEIQDVIKTVARRNGLAESLLWSVIQVESHFDPRAQSPKGAQGLMQLMPETVALYKVKDSFDVKENVEAGARYLKDLLQQFNQDLVLALAAYNAGPSAVISHQGVPPFPETQNYIRRVLGRHN
jgi:soluble lytic murein transglycosylase-like protein